MAGGARAPQQEHRLVILTLLHRRRGLANALLEVQLRRVDQLICSGRSGGRTYDRLVGGLERAQQRVQRLLLQAPAEIDVMNGAQGLRDFHLRVNQQRKDDAPQAVSEVEFALAGRREN